jgi:hypothetical protein
MTGLHVSRAAKRTLACQIKWFDDNWPQLEPILPLFTLLDAAGRPINFVRQFAETV